MKNIHALNISALQKKVKSKNLDINVIISRTNKEE